MSRWISVEDRLPDPGVEVIAWDGRDWHKANHEGEGLFWSPEMSYMDDVTHWMPAPGRPDEPDGWSSMVAENRYGTWTWECWRPDGTDHPMHHAGMADTKAEARRVVAAEMARLDQEQTP